MAGSPSQGGASALGESHQPRGKSAGQRGGAGATGQLGAAASGGLQGAAAGGAGESARRTPGGLYSPADSGVCPAAAVPLTCRSVTLVLH